MARYTSPVKFMYAMVEPLICRDETSSLHMEEIRGWFFDKSEVCLRPIIVIDF